MMRAFVLAALLIVAPVGARAATCTVSATGIAFGTYVPSSPTAATSTGTVTVNCSNLGAQSVPYTLALNSGVNSGGSFSNRRMANGTTLLSYQLYSDAARSRIWGNGTGGTLTLTGTCTITAFTCSSNQTVYASIPARQAPKPGAFTDTVTVTVTY